MKEKLCPKCSQIKSSSEFWVRRRKTADGSVQESLQYYCKSCSSSRRATRYLSNREREVSLRKSWEAGNREWFNEFKKTLKCEGCGESRWYILDFHHKDPSLKDFEVACFLKFSKSRVLREVEKCEVLCANCHREKHFLERLASGTVWYGRLPVTQDIQPDSISGEVAS